jgi:CBS domain-containing protein
MLCEEIMKQKVERVSLQDTAQHAAHLMRNEKVGFLPVCDETGKVLGTITDRDIAIRLVADDKPASTHVADIMTRQVVACRPQDKVKDAEKLMAQKRKSRIMCIDEGGKLIGIISLSDIAQHDRKGRVSDTIRGVTEREARP